MQRDTGRATQEGTGEPAADAWPGLDPGWHRCGSPDRPIRTEPAHPALSPGSAQAADLVSRYWVPVWQLATPQRRRTLQYPECLVVVADSYQRFYGLASGLAEITLKDSGWVRVP